MQQIAIYGAGSHTRSLLDWGLPDHLSLLGFIETQQVSTERLRSHPMPLTRLAPFARMDNNASATSEGVAHRNFDS